MRTQTNTHTMKNGRFQNHQRKIIHTMKKTVDTWKTDNRVLCELIARRTGNGPSAPSERLYEKQGPGTSDEDRLYIRECGDVNNNVPLSFEPVIFDSELFSLLENCTLDGEVLSPSSDE